MVSAITIVSFLVFSLNSLVPQDSVPPTLEEALEIAHSTNKNIFVNFHADWCLPCQMLKEDVLSKGEVVTQIKANFVHVQIDVDTEESNPWKEAYTVKRLPAIFVLNTNGEILEKVDDVTCSENLLLILSKYDTVGKSDLLNNNTDNFQLIDGSTVRADLVFASETTAISSVQQPSPGIFSDSQPSNNLDQTKRTSKPSVIGTTNENSSQVVSAPSVKEDIVTETSSRPRTEKPTPVNYTKPIVKNSNISASQATQTKATRKSNYIVRTKYTVTVGAFAIEENAIKFKTLLSETYGYDLFITHDDKGYHILNIGKFSSSKECEEILKELTAEGVENYVRKIFTKTNI